MIAAARRRAPSDPRMPMRFPAVAALLAAAAIVLAALPLASASAASPWWGLTSGERPTNLQSGFARDEVQEITTSTKVIFQLKVNGSAVELNGNEGIFMTEPFFKENGEIYPQPTPANIQKALEGVEAYGEGTVVTGGPAGVHPFVVTNHGKLVPKLQVIAKSGEAKVKVLSEGRPDGQVIVVAQNRGSASTSGAVTIDDQLPPGLEAVAIEGLAINPGGSLLAPTECKLSSLTCTFGEVVPGTLPPYQQIEARIGVVVKPGAASGELNTASVSGGGPCARSAPATRSW